MNVHTVYYDGHKQQPSTFTDMGFAMSKSKLLYLGSLEYMVKKCIEVVNGRKIAKGD